MSQQHLHAECEAAWIAWWIDHQQPMQRTKCELTRQAIEAAKRAAFEAGWVARDRTAVADDAAA